MADLPMSPANGSIHGKPGFRDRLFHFLNVESGTIEFNPLKTGIARDPKLVGQRSFDPDHIHFQTFVNRTHLRLERSNGRNGYGKSTDAEEQASEKRGTGSKNSHRNEPKHRPQLVKPYRADVPIFWNIRSSGSANRSPELFRVFRFLSRYRPNGIAEIDQIGQNTQAFAKVDIERASLAAFFRIDIGVGIQIQLNSRNFWLIDRIESKFFKIKVVLCQPFFGRLHFLPKLFVEFLLSPPLFKIERNGILFLPLPQPLDISSQILKFLQLLLPRFASLLQSGDQITLKRRTDRKPIALLFPVPDRNRVPSESIGQISLSDRKIIVKRWKNDMRNDSPVLRRLTIGKIKFLNRQFSCPGLRCTSEKIIFKLVNRLNRSFSMSGAFTKNQSAIVAFKRSRHDLRSRCAVARNQNSERA